VDNFGVYSGVQSNNDERHKSIMTTTNLEEAHKLYRTAKSDYERHEAQGEIQYWTLRDSKRVTTYLNAVQPSRMSPRQQHAENLSYIRDITGEYNRRFSFKEAETFCETYQYYLDEGYPSDMAAQYAYDHYFVDRRVKS
jgi:hypothetical protein